MSISWGESGEDACDLVLGLATLDSRRLGRLQAIPMVQRSTAVARLARPGALWCRLP